MLRSVKRAAERGLQAGILTVFVVGLRRRSPGAVVNAVCALFVTALPRRLERRYDLEFEGWQRLYVDAGMLTHAVGMLGPYDDVWWWDNVTHTCSATLLGGVVFAVARRRDRNPRPRVVAVVVCLGVLWEAFEYAIHAVAKRFGVEPILVSYGSADVAADLAFDLLGALLVLAFGDRLLDNLVPTDEHGER
ncbi:hypothetical protein [Halococcus hamelinensis]|uniref:DUF2238 domain-containing protein n=1 Tax=Halococcus hamelinensis 100A6 TaxID=1132509 RepID=M0LZI1_9EURY|nr:hypothetical protein [Halococcus hamelinensis]EMA38563.1 hypothetical protein C447_09212 [Halococcus hamelinensis 100A6]